MTAVVIGYDDTQSLYRRSPDQAFFLHVAPDRRPLSVKEECLRAAREIGDRFHGERLTVVYSGGRDSDFVLESFRRARVPVKAVIVLAKDGMNLAEALNASEFEVRAGFGEFEVVEFDHRSFITSSEYRDLLRRAQCPYSSFLWYWGALLGKVKGPLVCGVMEPAFGLAKGVWAISMPEYEYSVYRVYDQCGVVGVPSFFCWDAELWASFMLSPTYYDCMTNKRAGAEHSNAVKGDLLEQTFGHRSRPKQVIHVRQEFWTDLSLGGTDIFTVDARSWFAAIRKDGDV